MSPAMHKTPKRRETPKRRLRLWTLAVALASPLCSCGQTDGLGPGSCTYLSSFETADDYQLVAGRTAYARAAAAAGSDIYVAGYAHDGGNYHWITRKSADGGGTWDTVDEFESDPANHSYAYAMAAESGSVVYAAGKAYISEASGNYHWIVRKSSDGGDSWSTVDSYELDAQKNASPESAAIGGGSLFVAGGAYDNDGTSNSRWVIRRSADGGISWSLSDDYEYTLNQDASAKHVTSAIQWVLASGYASDGAKSHWITRKSAGGADAWSVADDYNLPSGQDAYAQAADVVDSSIYVAGYAEDGSSGEHWIVRKSVDAGQTWSTADDFEYVAGQDSRAYSLSHVGGDIYAAGYGTLASGKTRWLIRRSTDGGASWTTVDEYEMATGQSSQVFSLVPVLADIVAVGMGSSLFDYHWIVRTLPCVDI